MKKFLSTIALFAVASLLGACYESTDVTLHEPGVYKGAAHLQGNDSGRQDALRKRFELVQLDR